LAVRTGTPECHYLGHHESLMNGLPSLSVIIPCYNGWPLVGESVRSVLDQADGGVECVLVDDGSKDGSADKVAAAFGSRVRVVRKPNGGAASARNRGWDEATGDLLVWLDADDYLTSGSLAPRRRPFAEDPRLEMLVGRQVILNVDTGEETTAPAVAPPADYLHCGLLDRRDLPHSNLLTFRRSALTRVPRYDETLKIAEDFTFWVHAWALLRWRFLDHVLAVQRIGEFPSLSKSRGKLFFYDQVGLALRRVRPFLRAHTGSDWAWRQAYAEYAADYALLYLRRGDRSQTRRWAGRALSAAPRLVGPRAGRYLLEATLPTRVYALGRAAAARVGWAESRLPLGRAQS
jgi:glycosyltransferase involved in cell wall biosynthesis